MSSATDSSTTSLRLREVRKSFVTRPASRDRPAETLDILRGVDLALEAGERAVILGPSGSGKSTLLQILGTLDRPTSGQVTIHGEEPFSLDDEALARFRNREIGFVFQEHHLLPQFSVLENVLLPTFAAGSKDAVPDARARALELLERVGLSQRLEHRPAELSGGERQRVAVARALICRPTLLLCDEPTGSLDLETAQQVADLLLEIHAAEPSVLIAVTHSLELAARFDRRFELTAGRLEPAA
ncbi:MAG: ABC transporter ATP-binding protein [Acidobacteriota bacterium]